MKKVVSIVLAAVLALSLAACSNGADPTTAAPAAGGSAAAEPTAPAAEKEDNFDTTQAISVNSREDGSGTRGAFVELFGVKQDGVDMTTEEAAVNNSTSVMMTAVAGNPFAIGYISLGSLNDTVKAVKINGAKASVENIKAGTYPVSRPFNIATEGELSEVAQDFVDYIMSAEGQAVIADSGYIATEGAPAYAGSQPSGKIVVAGSSSVTPVMEKLKEAYLAINANAQIEVQESDSTTGMNSAIDGTCDIGMASRALKDSEIEAGLTETTIAIDGIAVIVNNGNPVDNLTADQVMSIYVGETTVWSEVIP